MVQRVKKMKKYKVVAKTQNGSQMKTEGINNVVIGTFTSLKKAQQVKEKFESTGLETKVMYQFFVIRDVNGNVVEWSDDYELISAMKKTKYNNIDCYIKTEFHDNYLWNC